jgi:hypothetical protein
MTHTNNTKPDVKEKRPIELVTSPDDEIVRFIVTECTQADEHRYEEWTAFVERLLSGLGLERGVDSMTPAGDEDFDRGRAAVGEGAAAVGKVH